MRRGVIRIGDPLSGGGQVMSACSLFKVDGKEVAGVGDACHCRQHGDVQIVEGIETFTFFGKKLALHGCKVSCGCTLISTTDLMAVDTGGGGVLENQQESQPAARIEAKHPLVLAEGEAQSGTDNGDLSPVPAAVTQPNGGNALPAPGQGTTNDAVVETPGGGEKARRLPRTNGKEILVDLEAQNLSAYDMKKLVYSFDIISGNKDNPTPVGRFRVTRKVTPYRSKKYDAPMNYAMFFNEGNAIHQFHGPFELDRFAKGISDWFGSHGCVRLSEENARTLYKWTPVGTPVEVFR